MANYMLQIFGDQLLTDHLPHHPVLKALLNLLIIEKSLKLILQSPYHYFTITVPDDYSLYSLPTNKKLFLFI